MNKAFLYSLVFTALISCSRNQDDEALPPELTAIESYLDSLAIDAIIDSSGVYAYPIISDSTAKTQDEGDVLRFFYTLSVFDGEIIDVKDSLDTDTTVVRQGVNAIYPIGVDVALSYLKEGEKWGFIIPSNMGFGSFGYSNLIPANATLMMEIELISITSEQKIQNHELVLIDTYVESSDIEDTTKVPLEPPIELAGGMIYKKLKQGSGSTPALGNLVSLTYEGRFLDSTVFDRRPNADFFEFYFGEESLIQGFEIGVSRMLAGERALLIMPSSLAYRESATIIPEFLTDEMVELEIIPAYAAKVGPYRPLIFEIELLSIE